MQTEACTHAADNQRKEKRRDREKFPLSHHVAMLDGAIGLTSQEMLLSTAKQRSGRQCQPNIYI